MSDRRVHARLGTAELARYDKQGRWYVEDTRSRRRVSFQDAVAAARAWKAQGGEVYGGLPGGGLFDAHVSASAAGSGPR